MKAEDAARECFNSFSLALPLLSWLGPCFARCCLKTKDSTKLSSPTQQPGKCCCTCNDPRGPQGEHA